MNLRGWLRPKKRNNLEYGIRSQKSKGYVYYAEGFVKGFPYKYRLVALSIYKGKVTEETTILNNEIISEILRTERRDSHRSAIYGLFLYRSPNFVIKLSAITSKGKELLLLDEAVYISAPGFHVSTLIANLCEALCGIANNLSDSIKDLDLISQVALRSALLYNNNATNQFWLSATITSYVSLTRNRDVV